MSLSVHALLDDDCVGDVGARLGDGWFGSAKYPSLLGDGAGDEGEGTPSVHRRAAMQPAVAGLRFVEMGQLRKTFGRVCHAYTLLTDSDL